MTYTSTVKPYKGWGMNGAVAKWYATLTKKSLDDFRRLAQQTAEQLPPHAAVLEIAPGPGYFAIELAKLGDYAITGLDISETFVEIARANADKAKVHVDFQHGDAANIPLPDGMFDFIFCRAAFKNFSAPLRALEEMYRVLKPGGHALIIDLRRDSSRQSINQAIDAMKVGAINSIITKLTFRFMLLKRAYTKKEIELLVAKTQFREAQIRDDLTSMEIVLRKDTAQ